MKTINLVDPRVAIISRYIHIAIKSPHVKESDKVILAEAIGWFETFPFSLVSPTEEGLLILQRELSELNEQVTRAQRRTRRFRIRELIYEAKFKHEQNRVLGGFRKQEECNLNEARALAFEDEQVYYFYNRWLLSKACRKESEIIAKAYQDAANAKQREYHLTKDKVEGKLMATIGE